MSLEESEVTPASLQATASIQRLFTFCLLLKLPYGFPRPSRVNSGAYKKNILPRDK